MSVLLIAGRPSRRSRSEAVLKRVKHQLSRRGLLVNIGHPSLVSAIIKDNVVIYAGSTLGGRLTLQRAAAVGGNPGPARDVAPDSRLARAWSFDEAVANAMLHCPD